MRKKSAMPTALLAGAICGIAVLGVAGRLVMALVALSGGFQVSITLPEILGTVTVGAAAGALGGVITVLLRKVAEWSDLERGSVAGLVLFFFSLFFALVRGRISIVISARQFLTLAAIALLFVSFGIATAFLIRRFQR